MKENKPPPPKSHSSEVGESSDQTVPVAFVIPWTMENTMSRSYQDELPISETKRSFQRQRSFNKTRFTKPKPSISRTSSMVRSYPAPDSVARLTEKPTARHRPRSAKESKSVVDGSTDATLSPRYRQSDSLIFPMHVDEDCEDTYSEIVKERKKDMNLNFRKHSAPHPVSSSAPKSTNWKNSYPTNPIYRKLFKTSDEFIQSIHSNLNTSHSQSTDELRITKSNKGPDDPLNQSSDNLSVPQEPFYLQQSQMMPIPTQQLAHMYPPPPMYSDPPYLSASADVFQFTESYIPYPPEEEEDFYGPDDWFVETSTSSDRIDRLHPVHICPTEEGCYFYSDLGPASPLGTFHTRSMGDVRSSYGGPYCDPYQQHLPNLGYFTSLKPVKGTRTAYDGQYLSSTLYPSCTSSTHLI